VAGAHRPDIGPATRARPRPSPRAGRLAAVASARRRRTMPAGCTRGCHAHADGPGREVGGRTDARQRARWWSLAPLGQHASAVIRLAPRLSRADSFAPSLGRRGGFSHVRMAHGPCLLLSSGSWVRVLPGALGAVTWLVLAGRRVGRGPKAIGCVVPVVSER
jgi:hypothetical protein